MRFLSRCSLQLLLWLPAVTGRTADAVAPVTWSLKNVGAITGRPVKILGKPQWDKTGPGGLRFNGATDGVVIPEVAIEGWASFTIEALISPDADGPAEQRFIHFEDELGHRGLLEIRVLKDGQWCVDTFLFTGADNHLALMDRTKLHPAGRWHWIALSYTDGRMTHFVDGVKECEGTLRFPPMKAGRTSLGVRLNKTHWFKGAIHEVRFHPAALPAEKLQRVISLPGPARRNSSG